MRRIILNFGLVLFAICFVRGTFAGVGGLVDRRQVIGWLPGTEPWYCQNNTNCKNIWNTQPYYNYVYISACDETRCWGGTGELISPKHILTNKHVADGCGLDGRERCIIRTFDGKGWTASVVGYEGNPKILDGKESDWVILEADYYISKHYFGYRSPTPLNSSGVWRAGFGGLNVLSNQDIKNIRTAYEKWLHVVHPYNFFDGVKNDMKQIHLDYEGHTITSQPNYYKTFLDTFKELTGKDFITDYLNDNHTLKVIRNCSISTGTHEGMASHNCQSWAGDSGSSLQNSSNQIVLLNNAGLRYVTSEKEYINMGVLTQRIFTDKIVEMLNKAKNESE